MLSTKFPRMKTLGRAAGIVVTCIMAAVFYGIVHDLVTAHVCVEYFTVAHPMVVLTDSPVILALVWGVLATWWVGLLLGIPLAIVALAGSRPQVAVAQLLPRTGKLLAAMGVTATLAGLVGVCAEQKRSHISGATVFEDIPKGLVEIGLLHAVYKPARQMTG